MEAKVIPLHYSYPTIYRLNPHAGTTLPLFSASVRAGFPSPAADYSSEPIDLNRLLSDNPTATFLVRVEGDSMIGAHIEPGDMAVIDRSVKATTGKIVLAFVEGEFTIKRLLLKKDGAYLMPENPKYKAMKFENPDNCRIWGVVVGIVKRL
ncbi:LexA family protein [Pontibacter burrus]|uniref:Translesion error-prone DNA polymerase V autoproteolytic subunit n=1 Tax=Pontibacter burrus TaxID=2704466 RepID=A0A6B3LXJ7_9BACT|nr:translesion error-prone DNA polymerase V autoproteolytic subunit [Pontibacter burrus]NEM98197.1 translesion error-prone DNA polymerase V autoproteolytic subunit [Pontibacter burrus]